MTSTTGAYGDFPSYYYKRGNLFGSYLLGKTPAMSRDTRRELEALEGGFAVSVPNRKRRGRAKQSETFTPRPTKPAQQPTQTAHDALMDYVQAHLSSEGAKRVVVALSASRGIDPPAFRGRDPLAVLDEFAFRHLSPEDQLKVRVRLEQSIRALSTMERKPAAPSRQKKSRGRTPGARARLTRGSSPERANRAIAAGCALCGRRLLRSEQARCREEPEVFMSQVYCTEHADKVEALFRGQG